MTSNNAFQVIKPGTGLTPSRLYTIWTLAKDGTLADMPE